MEIVDWLAERSGFEPAVPILELLDDSSWEGFQNWSTSRPISKRATFFRRSLYRPFFRRSAQRFFIASDNRFLPSAVRRPRLLLFAVGAEAAAFPFEVAAGEWVPSRCGNGSTKPLPFPLQLRHDSVKVQDSILRHPAWLALTLLS